METRYFFITYRANCIKISAPQWMSMLFIYSDDIIEWNLKAPTSYICGMQFAATPIFALSTQNKLQAIVFGVGQKRKSYLDSMIPFFMAPRLGCNSLLFNPFFVFEQEYATFAKKKKNTQNAPFSHHSHFLLAEEFAFREFSTSHTYRFWKFPFGAKFRIFIV